VSPRGAGRRDEAPGIGQRGAEPGRRDLPPGAAPDQDLLELIDHLGRLLERSDLAELEVEAGETSILLRRAEEAAGHQASASAPATPPAPVPEPLAEPAGPRTHAVLAPLTGIFYAAPAPEAPPFVNVGVEVVVGQVIGLIEAMKLFNEIKSDIAGRVQRVVAETGHLVKARDPLIEVVPGG
jgi:acetyl-CoA carboxylase biotin carboxyl carrier protein